MRVGGSVSLSLLPLAELSPFSLFALARVCSVLSLIDDVFRRASFVYRDFSTSNNHLSPFFFSSFLTSIYFHGRRKETSSRSFSTSFRNCFSSFAPVEQVCGKIVRE